MKLLLFTLICSYGYAKVHLGIDTLFSNQKIMNYLDGKSVAILTHHAAKDSAGEHIIDLLNQHSQFRIEKLFTPEHGLRKLEDDWIEDGVDEKSGIPYYSLYKVDRRAPTPQLLKGIDTIIIDLQDVGMRFYTFAATMALTMKAASENNVGVIILDRPNPLGNKIEGFVLDKSLWGHLISYRNLPTRHGLTMGELAKFYYHKLGLTNSLFVSTVKGWDKTRNWDATGNRWNIPSPALPLSRNAYLYSITGPLESFNLAVGRGINNSMAFEIIGAPWISEFESKLLAFNLNKISHNIHFSSYSWRATRAKYVGEINNGVRINFLDYSQLNGFETLVKMLHTFHHLFGENFKPTLTKNWTHRYLGNLNVLNQIKAGRMKYVLKQARKSQIEYRKFLKKIRLY